MIENEFQTHIGTGTQEVTIQLATKKVMHISKRTAIYMQIQAILVKYLFEINHSF